MPTTLTQTAPAAWSFVMAPDLIERLIAAQNALIDPIDIMTWAGMCDSRRELEDHVVRYEARVEKQAVQS